MITDEFTKNLLKYCRENTIKRIDEHINKEQYNSIRIALENDLDDPLLFKHGKVLPEKLNVFKGRQFVYSLFMQNYIKTIDESHNRR